MVVILNGHTSIFKNKCLKPDEYYIKSRVVSLDPIYKGHSLLFIFVNCILFKSTVCAW